MTIQRNLGLVLGIVALSACDRRTDTTRSDRAERTGTESVARPDREDRDTNVRTPAADRDRDRDDTSERMVPASRVLPAAESIADARCAREQKCNNIGADRKYSSMSDCLTRVRNDWKDDLNARECPAGADQKELNECLAEIRNEDCNDPLDSLGRIAACTAAQICEEDADRDGMK
jgi:hypothetical protein